MEPFDQLSTQILPTIRTLVPTFKNTSPKRVPIIFHHLDGIQTIIYVDRKWFIEQFEIPGSFEIEIRPGMKIQALNPVRIQNILHQVSSSDTIYWIHLECNVEHPECRYASAIVIQNPYRSIRYHILMPRIVSGWYHEYQKPEAGCIIL